jgi:hypothetical protein
VTFFMQTWFYATKDMFVHVINYTFLLYSGISVHMQRQRVKAPVSSVCSGG